MNNQRKFVSSYIFLSKKSAFSLAEVLLTIVIIGVLAVMVIPLLNQGIGKHEILTKVNKANSVLGQTLMKIAYSEGLPIADLSFISEDGDAIFFDKFSNFVDTIKVCKGMSSDCFTTGEIKQLNGTNAGSLGLSSSLVTKDGFVYGWQGKALCGNKGLSNEDLNNCVGSFVVDINGDRLPNRYGYDIFFFPVVDTKGIIPAGKGNKSYDCNRARAGITCAAKVIDDQGVNYH